MAEATTRTPPDTELAERLVDELNHMLEVDDAAICSLACIRVPCNEAMGDHPSIQVLAGESGTPDCVGLVGILNGMCGTYPNGWGCIAAKFEDGRLVRFVVLDEGEALNMQADGRS